MERNQTPERPTSIVTTKHETSWTLAVNFNIVETAEGFEYDMASIVTDHEPELRDVVNAVNNFINAKTDEKILSGFVWRENPVWLSSENQFNFKCAYDLAYQTQGASLPATYKLGEDKDGTPIYFEFKDLETFSDFYLGCIVWIQKCINEGWKEKDSIDYDEIMKT